MSTSLITSESMAEMLPEVQRKPFLWTITKLERKEWAMLSNVPNNTERCMKAPPASAIIRVTGRERVKEFIEARLIWLIAQLNVAHPMTIPQRNFTADSILDRYPNESLADFALVFLRLAQGYYGSTYHQLDCSIVMAAMAQHMEEKAMYVERDETTAKKESFNEVDYDAFKKRLDDERRKAEQKKSTDREVKIQSYLNRNGERKNFTVETKWGKMHNVLAVSQQAANDIVGKLLLSGNLKEKHFERE
jgi:hypothetical protein